MNYQETVNWMFKQLPMYQLQGASAYKADLTNSKLLSDYLGNPEENLKFIHIAGTNGKGSTSHMLSSILQEAGYKTGLYTSPHLKDFRERIKINGIDISEEFVREFIAKHKTFFEEHSLSFFEMSVGLAFDYFNSEKVDIAIIEVGLGGRLDATNIITPLISVITNIGIDHTQFLGNTITSISTEKAGIIKKNIPIVIGENVADSKLVFLAKAEEKNATIYFASELITEIYPTGLTGNYQVSNVKTVQQTVRVLQSLGNFNVTENNIKDGLLNVITNTVLRGRWQQIRSRPTVICDTAHNEHGLKIVLEQVLSSEFDTLHIVIGMVADKNLDDILKLFPKTAKYYFCMPKISRGLNATTLQLEAAEYGLNGEVFNSVSEAYNEALQSASETDFIFIGGSTFVIAEIL